MAGIGIITNPHSKLNKKDPDRPKYLSYIAGEKGKLEITQDLKQLSIVAEKFVEKKPEIIAINGGDGTISRTLTALIDAYPKGTLPPIAILRGGTINMLASNLKIRGGTEYLLYQLMERYSTGETLKTRKVSTIEVEGKFGFLYADFTCTYFLEKFYDNKTGPLGSLSLLIKVLLSRFFYPKFFQKIVPMNPIIIQADGKLCFSGHSISNLISTVPKMPLGPMLFPNTREGGKMEMRSFMMTPKQAFWKVPIYSLFQPQKQRHDLPSYLGDSFTVESKTSIPYTLDGEIFHSTNPQLTVNRGPEIEFILL